MKIFSIPDQKPARKDKVFMTTTQINIVRKHLKKGKSITSLQAFKMANPITRLSSIIHRLRGEGMKIKTIKMKGKNGSTYAKYKL